jgi:hypothetical protein
LEIVRVRYWHHIEEGRLPRESFSAKFLLYSVDVGMDTGSIAAGDWQIIEEEIDHAPFLLRFLNMVEDNCPSWLSRRASLGVGKIEASRETQMVYILTSFIEAHQHAQRKIHSFVGCDDVDDEDSDDDEPVGGVSLGSAATAAAMMGTRQEDAAINATRDSDLLVQAPEESIVIAESSVAVSILVTAGASCWEFTCV